MMNRIVTFILIILLAGLFKAECQVILAKNCKTHGGFVDNLIIKIKELQFEVLAIKERSLKSERLLLQSSIELREVKWRLNELEFKNIASVRTYNLYVKLVK